MALKMDLSELKNKKLKKVQVQESSGEASKSDIGIYAEMYVVIELLVTPRHQNWGRLWVAPALSTSPKARTPLRRRLMSMVMTEAVDTRRPAR